MFVVIGAYAQAEFVGYDNTEEEIDLIAKNRLYPGGIDEDDLEVKENIEGIKPHVTTATLLWRARRSVDGSSPESNSNGNNQ